MKILQIVPSYKPAYIYGGPIESVSKLCEGLVDAGHDVEVYTTTANGNSELEVEHNKKLIVDGVTVTYFKRITKDPTHVSLALWRHLYKNVTSFEVVHIQSWWNILVIGAAAICQLKGVKVVIAPRGMLSEYIFSFGMKRIKKLIHISIGKKLLSNSVLHATAESEYSECIKIIPGWRGFILPNIISLPEIESIKKKNTIFKLIYMSRIHPKKGLEIVFEALSNVDFLFELQIAGSGETSYIEELKELAVNLGISEKIKWLGWLDRHEKFKTLMSADLFLLLSKNENFANVVIESLHMGTPVLLSKDVGLSSFIEKEDLGWVTSLNVEEVANSINEIFRDTTKQCRINAFGRIIVERNFSSKVVIAKYIEEYTKLLKRDFKKI